jgi:Zn-finger domain-containing protein
MESGTNESEWKTLDKNHRHLDAAGFSVTSRYCNSEFKSIMNAIMEELDADANLNSEKEHVTEAEQDNCVTKERMRAMTQRLPFEARLPQVLIRYLATVTNTTSV